VLSPSPAHTINSNIISSSCTRPYSRPPSNNSNKPISSQSTRVTHNSNTNNNRAHTLPHTDLLSSNMDTHQSLLLPAAQALLHPTLIRHHQYNMVDIPTM
jgi:hypothetical protein